MGTYAAACSCRSWRGSSAYPPKYARGRICPGAVIVSSVPTHTHYYVTHHDPRAPERLRPCGDRAAPGQRFPPLESAAHLEERQRDDQHAQPDVRDVQGRVVTRDRTLRGERDAAGVDVPPEEHLREVDQQEDAAVDL